MSVMDCQTFDSSLLDALYDGVATATSAAMDEHAAGCSSCATQLARLKKSRELYHPLLESPFPDGLEDRILAAAEAAMDATTGATAKANDPPPSDVVVHLADRARPAHTQGKTGVVAFLSRPQFAIAATFLLVLGAAALFLNTSAKREASAVSMADQAPAAASAPADDNQQAPPVTAATAAAPMASYAMAPPPMPAAPRAVADNRAESGKAKAALRGGGGAPESDKEESGPAATTFAAAKSLYDGARYTEALPKFEALAPSSPEAELYVARCLVNTKGCAAAIPRYDSAARRSAGTATGSHAALEAARCLNRTGQTAAARTRYKSLGNDNYVAAEANAELDALEAPKSSVKATPQATATPAQRQAAPPSNAR